MADNSVRSIRIWDLPVRLFHWALVILLIVSYFTGRWGGDWMKFHFWSGYTILTLAEGNTDSLWAPVTTQPNTHGIGDQPTDSTAHAVDVLRIFDGIDRT